jgi:hypothetical protein
VVLPRRALTGECKTILPLALLKTGRQGEPSKGELLLLFSLSVDGPAGFLRAALVGLAPARACVRVGLGGGDSSTLDDEVEDEEEGELSER